MNSTPFSVVPPSTVVSPQTAPLRTRGRTVLIASSDPSVRERLRNSLTELRWHVLEAPGGAEAWFASQSTPLEALLIDPWLPDLDVGEFLAEFHRDHPLVDLLMTDGALVLESPRSPYHQELLYALRRSQESDTAAWNVPTKIFEGSGPATLLSPSQMDQSASFEASGWQLAGVTPKETAADPGVHRARLKAETERSASDGFVGGSGGLTASQSAAIRGALIGNGERLDSIGVRPSIRREMVPVERIPELIGTSPVMIEVSRRIRLVAARSTPVLIEGPTGSGKELVAEALHRLSGRSRKPFVAINCAAIPEALLEAELFGHTRGAFTGAVQGRIGRIESADGGTLFLDEIGEMPLGLQSKLLRFFESGELQRIGDNETVKVDVRIIAATHQPLADDAQKGTFRADLYYRLAVFLIRTPSLAEHMQDLPQLVSYFLERLGRKSPVKRVDASAIHRLQLHVWPGNVRELEHVLERATILAGDEPVITAAEIDFGLSAAN